jgi:hypothetical protein
MQQLKPSSRMPDSAEHAGDKLVEMVRWLQRGDIESEASLLQALAQAPLPRRPGAPSQNASLSAPAGLT